jgi:TonB family protein
MRLLHLALAVIMGLFAGCRSLGRPAPAPGPPRVWEWHAAAAASDVDAAILVSRFADPDRVVRAEAVWRLPAANPSPSDLEALERLLDDPDASVRDHVSLALFRLRHPLFTAPADAMPKTGGDYDEMPKVLKMARPVYPTDAAVRRVEGMVVVEMLVSATGRVLRAKVVESIPALDEAALVTVQQWEFRPASKNGRAVPCIAYGEVKFRLL